MSNIQRFQVEEGSEQLIGIHFEFYSRHGTLLAIFFYGFVEIVLVVVHNNIQVLLAGLLLVGEEGILHGEHIRMMQHLQNIKLPILIIFILIHFLNRNNLQSLFISSFMHSPKCSTAYFPINLITVRPHTFGSLGFALEHKTIVFGFGDL